MVIQVQKLARTPQEKQAGDARPDEEVDVVSQAGFIQLFLRPERGHHRADHTFERTRHRKLMSSEKSRLRSIAGSGVPARLSQSSGRRLVDLEGFTIDGDTVLARRILNGDLLVFQVLQDEFGISI